MRPLASRMSVMSGEGALSVFARAKELERTGRSIIHLELGEPDFHPGKSVIESAAKALQDGKDRYCAVAGVPALRDLATPAIKTATADGETFPALIVSQGVRRTTFYDLTAPPPVQRTVDSSAIKITDTSTWRHSSVLASYRDPDLESILTFLRAVVR